MFKIFVEHFFLLLLLLSILSGYFFFFGRFLLSHPTNRKICASRVWNFPFLTAKQTLNTNKKKCKIFHCISDIFRPTRSRKKGRNEVGSSSFRHFHAVHCANNFFCINFVPLSVLLLPFKILISFYFGLMPPSPTTDVLSLLANS